MSPFTISVYNHAHFSFFPSLRFTSSNYRPFMFSAQLMESGSSSEPIDVHNVLLAASNSFFYLSSHSFYQSICNIYRLYFHGPVFKLTYQRCISFLQAISKFRATFLWRDTLARLFQTTPVLKESNAHIFLLALRTERIQFQKRRNFPHRRVLSLIELRVLRKFNRYRIGYGIGLR